MFTSRGSNKPLDTGTSSNSAISLSTFPSPSSSSSTANTNKTMPVTSTSTSTSTSTATATTNSPILQLLSARSKSPPKELTFLQPTLPLHITHLKALNSLLLPIPYPEKFYKEIIGDLDYAGRMSRIAYWSGERGCIGGIRGKIEEVVSSPEEEEEDEGGEGTRKKKVKIYIMTLCVRGPFRQLGVGKMLVDWLCEGGGLEREKFEVVEVYAHVWEMNEEALEWYRKRGFVVGEEVQEGYYRRLKPGGARVVRWVPPKMAER